ncbi:hypothetical protein DQ238_03385 [Geodermatophilus sp. TF02-6]|uniref:hypothetical protein n=1 Tax=Geodermatophilus sp. TF02-6 TaxID=2250575 RepID=UPI000DEBD3B8|nr:hypothetical protein [Geodermatophilus sp. TF02-6]RBY83041.1 hypothetical protein DQ238_03385 [Geodermatophilus sp. TF02-6]
MEVSEYRPDMTYRARSVSLTGDDPVFQDVVVRFADGLLLVETGGAVRVFPMHRVLEVAELEPVEKVDADQVTVPVRVR